MEQILVVYPMPCAVLSLPHEQLYQSSAQIQDTGMMSTPTFHTRTQARRGQVGLQHLPGAQKPGSRTAPDAHAAGPLTWLRPRKALGTTLPISPAGLCTNLRPHEIRVCPC